MGAGTLACWILYNFFLFELRFSKTALLRVACRPSEPECLEVGPTILFCFCFHSKWCLCTINLRTALKAPTSLTTLSNNREKVMVETKAMWCLQSVIRVFTALFMYLSLHKIIICNSIFINYRNTTLCDHMYQIIKSICLIIGHNE